MSERKMMIPLPEWMVREIRTIQREQGISVDILKKAVAENVFAKEGMGDTVLSMLVGMLLREEAFGAAKVVAQKPKPPVVPRGVGPKAPSESIKKELER